MSMALLGAMLLSCSKELPLPVTLDSQVAERALKQSASVNIGPGERIIGSAMLLPNGRIVTNLHVVQHRTDSVRITLDGANFIPVKLIAKDTQTDLALFQLPPDEYSDLSLPEIADPQAGIPIFAYGAAFGLHQSYLQGYISHPERRLEKDTPHYVQTQGITCPGMSGAPVYTLRGHWVGINRAAYGYSVGTGIGLIIPASTVRAFLDQSGAEN
ncbi:MAG: trypsin-like peptidase domain-containing protein [Leptospiraceae bacterium]|nr:trypsin-like peptidase domain-containing protein [Leptospiraceae bacterium]